MACLPNRLLVAPWIRVIACACACFLTAALRADAPAGLPFSPELVRLVLNGETRVATVGYQAIFAGDILPTIDQSLEEAEQQIPEYLRDQQRAVYVKQLLPRKIEVKLVLLDFFRTIPDDKQKEVLANIDKQVDRQFYDEQAPKLMERMKVESLAALENKLKSYGSSINKQKMDFREQMIAQTMIGQSVDRSPEITHDELLKAYYEDIDSYKVEAKARWEKLTVLFKNYPDKAAADRAIVEMGNQVLRGASFEMVAKQHSQGVMAKQGGRHDWTTEGSLLSVVLDKAIFTLPENRLSRILTDDDGFHIVRVIERKDAHQVSFEEAQSDIHDQLLEEKRSEQVREYLDGLNEMTYIWTIFDDPSE